MKGPAMNPIRKFLIRRRLERLLKPDPAYRDHRLAQFTPERRARYQRNAELLRG